MAASSVGAGAGAAGGVSGLRAISRPNSTRGDGAPAPQTSTSSTRGQRPRTWRARSSQAACVKISRLSECATRYSSSASDDAVLTGTITAPIFAAPNHSARNSRQFGSSRVTVSPRRTPRRPSRWAVRFVSRSNSW